MSTRTTVSRTLATNVRVAASKWAAAGSVIDLSGRIAPVRIAGNAGVAERLFANSHAAAESTESVCHKTARK